MILKNGLVLIDKTLQRCDVRIDGGKIAQLEDSVEPFEGEEVYDFSDKVITPGFVNTHTHTPMAILKGVAEDLSFNDWLFKTIFPLEERLTSDAAYYGTMISMMEMAKHGVTAFCDMYFHMDTVARAVADFGMKALLTRGLTDDNGDDAGRLDENIALHNKWHGYDDRIFVGLGPHAPYTCSKDYLKRIIDVARVNDMIVAMHFFESIWEREKYTVSEIMSLGFDKVHFIPVHCVQLRTDELGMLSNAFPSINVASNMKLGNGIPPILEMLNTGLTLSIGTDGPASNNSLNPLFDLRVAMLSQKMKDPSVFTTDQAFSMLTTNGYKALRLEGGKIEVGSSADFAIFSTNDIQLQPLNRFLNNLLHAHTDSVFATMVNGKFVYYDGEFPTIDSQEVLKQFTTFSKKVTGIEN
ncbi:MAG TPA: amidohydrolase [Fervidobacterium sp.]|nr:amidohydrolase [Fervidobacterium sp.]HOL04466.1 amidohydrolase [Fervidobacterium sp.]HRB91744.1 amidohydrolase [Fervidobacterium sp.]